MKNNHKSGRPGGVVLKTAVRKGGRSGNFNDMRRAAKIFDRR